MRALACEPRELILPFKVQVGPEQVAIHHGQTVLVSEPDGQINWPSEKGLYFFDTRVVSSWAIYANGEPWDLLNGGAITYYASRIYLTNRRIRTTDGIIAPRTLGLVVSRSISGGLHEDLDITNNSMRRVRFQLEIAVRCDFADIFEVKSGDIVRRGRITTEWLPTKQRLRTTYRNGDFVRAVTIAVAHDHDKAVYANGRLSSRSTLSLAKPGIAACSTRWKMACGALRRCMTVSSSTRKRTIPKHYRTGCAPS
jgi:glycogen debranching enzyme